MAKCGFCGNEIERGTGKIKIMKDGKVIPLCSMKCEKNMFKLKRVSREMPWTNDYRALKVVRLSGQSQEAKKVKKSK